MAQPGIWREERVLLGEALLRATRESWGPATGQSGWSAAPACRGARLHCRGEEFLWLSLITQHQAEKAPVVPLQASCFLHVFFFFFPECFILRRKALWLNCLFYNQSTCKVYSSPFPQQIYRTAFLLYLKVHFSRRMQHMGANPGNLQPGRCREVAAGSLPAPQDDGLGVRARKQCGVSPGRLRDPVQSYSKALTAKLIKGPWQVRFWPPALAGVHLPHQIPVSSLHKVASPETGVARGRGRETELYFNHRGWLKASPPNM